MSTDKRQQILFTKLLIPMGKANRTGRRLDEMLYITIHETDLQLDRAPSYKDKNYYIRKIMIPPKERKEIGYHYLVSDDEIINFIPDNEYTRHTGSDYGNTVSIGIERLVNDGINHGIAIINQAKLAATLMEKYRIPIENVVPHKHWKNVQCPARLLAGQYGGWQGFLKLVEKYHYMKDFFPKLLK